MVVVMKTEMLML